MNGYNREIGYCYAFARYGRRCYHCNTTLQDLIIEAEIKEITTGVSRILPVILLENLENNGFHNDPTDPNLVPSCWPCNRNKNKFDTSQSSGNSTSREKLDNIKFKSAFHRNLRNYLMDNDHICFVEMIHGCENLSNGGGQTACTRYYHQMKLTKVNTKGFYQEFSYDCDYDNCNGIHVYLKGTIPQDIFKKEILQLQKDYNSQYMNGNKNKFTHHTATAGKQFVSFREYYVTHTTLVKQFQDVNLNDFL